MNANGGSLLISVLQRTRPGFAWSLAAELSVLRTLSGITAVSEPDALAVLARVSELYRALPAYSDTGTVVSPVAAVQFETSFERGTYLHFAYSDILPGRPRRQMARVTWERGHLTFWTLVNAPAPPTLRLAMAALTGVSSGAAHTVPSLLLPDEIGGWIPTDLKDPELGASDVVDDVHCVQVRGRHPRFPDRIFSLFVDPSTWLVRRKTRDGGTEITTYTPVVNNEVTEAP